MKTSLEHLPENKQANIQTIVDIIHDEFEQVVGFATREKKQHSRILLIVLFGSYAKGNWVEDPDNGYISDYDILVALNTDELVEDYKLWHTTEERITRKIKAPLNLIVHDLCDINNKLQQGHYFFIDIRKEGIQLYQYNEIELLEPKDLAPKEAKAIAEKHFKQWFESANGFIIAYRAVLESGDLKNAAFQLHQATERLYATVLLVFINYKPKTHSLRQLNSMAIQQNKAFKDIFPQDSKFNRRCFDLLRRAYIDARYSEHYQINQEELEWLYERVQQLKGLTEIVCQQHIAAF